MLIYVLYFLSLQQLSIAVQSSSDNRNARFHRADAHSKTLCVVVPNSVVDEVAEKYNPYDIQFWNSIAKAHIDRKLQLNKHLTREVRPKNVVLFIGDGMGIAAVTSARINKNQKTGSVYLNEPLYFENFQSTGLVKTSSSNNHVTDSAAGATALFTGWKVKTGTLGMKPITKEKCTNSSDSHITDGIVEGVLEKGMEVGFVTTTRITHATPAALYAKGVDRNFEFDGVTTEDEFKCTHDIAKQLLHYPASEFKVMMGGGSEYLMEKSRNGLRDDGLNIDLNWQSLPGNRKVLRNILDFEEFSSASDEKLLGVFSPSHFPFYLEEHLAGVKTVPRLWEMTSKAIEHLQNGQNGYFLVVEGGMIDTAEHENMMHMTFEEIYEFEKAIKKAREMTDMNETLIIVTADHGHALTLPGYLHSNETIFGNQLMKDEQRVRQELTEMWVPAMLFATGPGYNGFTFRNNDIDQPHYRQPSAIPTKLGFHSGEDVGIWADGPFSELVTVFH